MCPTGLVNSEADQFSGVFYSYFYNNVISWFHLFFLQDPAQHPFVCCLEGGGHEWGKADQVSDVDGEATPSRACIHTSSVPSHLIAVVSCPSR